MRVGIAGTGVMGSTHAESWSHVAGAVIAGFVAETEAEARPLADQYGARVHTHYPGLLADVDIVDICSPTHLHYEMVLQAAAAGKQVICEKPLARTLEQGQEMIAACRKAGVQLFVAHVVRFFPEYALAKAAVQEGQIGKPGVLRLRRGSFRPRKAAGNWFLDEEKSGGILLDMMIHDFDYARWVVGEVESVFARRVTQAHPDAPIDYGMVILTHRGGALSHVAGAWAYPPPTFRTGFEISGDAGMIDFDSDSTAPIMNLIQKSSESGGEVGLPSSPVSESPYTTQLKEFYAAIAQKRPARVSAADGLAALQIGLAAIESTKTGKEICLKPLAEVQP